MATGCGPASCENKKGFLSAASPSTTAAANATALPMMSLSPRVSGMLVQDAEGGTKVLRIKVQGAASHAEAELAARAVGNSPLVKTAFFGHDANWGRIVAALGRSGATFDPNDVSVRIGGVPVFSKGAPVPEDLDALLAPHMAQPTWVERQAV